MSTRVEDGVVQVLRTALSKLEEERETLDRLAEAKRQEFNEYVASQHESLNRRREALGTALQAMVLDEQTMGEMPSPGEDGPRLAISDSNLNTIREYLAAQDDEPVRQQDVVSDTGLNSGVVSVGLRRLMVEGEITRAGKINGSQAWARAPVMAGGAGGILSVKPGVGVSQASRL